MFVLNSQMGSHMKKAIFEEQTAKALMKWQKAAKERRKLRKAGEDVPLGNVSGDNTPSRGSSPLHLLHKYKTNPDLENSVSYPNSPRAYHSDVDFSDLEGPALNSSDDQNTRRDQSQQHKENAETVQKEAQYSDFSFSMS